MTHQGTPTQSDSTQLLKLRAQAIKHRTELRRLRAHLLEMRRDADGASNLIEANQQLVISALRAETIAGTALRDLEDMTAASHRDDLTGVATRTAILERVAEAVEAARDRGTRAAVLFCDLKGFKQVNDTHGHAVGDAVLAIVGRRLRAMVSSSDCVGRYGGDEFLVLLNHLPDPREALRSARRLLAGLLEPCMALSHQLRIEADIGIAVFPDHGDSVAQLIERADAAMYLAKDGDVGRAVLYAVEVAGRGPVRPRRRGLRRGADAGKDQFQAVGAARIPGLNADLVAANTQLVIAALSANVRECAAVELHRQQIRFMATVAHELRNPLAPIRIAAGMLDRACDDPVQFAMLQDIIEGQVTHMTRLIEDLLEGSRMATGKLKICLRQFDLNQLIDQVETTCAGPLAVRQQILTLHRLDPAPGLIGDPDRLVQVFGNLIGNASKFSPPGSTIVLRVRRRGRWIEISITDSGQGISAELLPYVFDLFAQERDSTGTRGSGLGIGLAVVRDLVGAHGGSVAALSAGRDLGSVFTVRLPLPPAGSPASGPASRAKGDLPRSLPGVAPPRQLQQQRYQQGGEQRREQRGGNE